MGKPTRELSIDGGRRHLWLSRPPRRKGDSPHVELPPAVISFTAGDLRHAAKIGKPESHRPRLFRQTRSVGQPPDRSHTLGTRPAVLEETEFRAQRSMRAGSSDSHRREGLVRVFQPGGEEKR